MGNILVVAEKPAVGMALSKVLGARNRQKGYMEGNGWLVSWCIGHLVELAPAEYQRPVQYPAPAYEAG